MPLIDKRRKKKEQLLLYNPPPMLPFREKWSFFKKFGAVAATATPKISPKNARGSPRARSR